MDTQSWLEEHPVIDIHLHLDGSISIASARMLESLVGQKLGLSDEELRERLFVPEGTTDLNEYLSKFDFPAELLQSSMQITACVRVLLQELAELGVAYSELRFAPQRQTWRGLTQREAIEAAISGFKDAPIPAGLIVCCMRGDDNEQQNRETLELAGEYLGKGVVALDLAGAEALFPTHGFEWIFTKAEALNIPYTIHAGEASGPESIRAALAMGARRIGHGVRAAEDKALLAQLAREHIVCELCPTSNLNTAVFADYKEFPLPAFMEAGVPVTINADNMSVSNTNVRKELAHMVEVFSLSDTDLKHFECNAVEAAFTFAAQKEELLKLYT